MQTAPGACCTTLLPPFSAPCWSGAGARMPSSPSTCGAGCRHLWTTASWDRPALYLAPPLHVQLPRLCSLWAAPMAWPCTGSAALTYERAPPIPHRTIRGLWRSKAAHCMHGMARCAPASLAPTRPCLAPAPLTHAPYPAPSCPMQRAADHRRHDSPTGGASYKRLACWRHRYCDRPCCRHRKGSPAGLATEWAPGLAGARKWASTDGAHGPSQLPAAPAPS